jgi:cysteine desulfurase
MRPTSEKLIPSLERSTIKMKRQIYLDNAATTRIRPEAMAEYVRVSEDLWGNPSSLHSLGSDAERVLTTSKQTILNTLGAKDSEIIFTASGTEANNIAIIGRALSKERYKKGAKIITTLGEHASVSMPLEELKKQGFKVAALSTKDGKIDMDELIKELTPDVILVSVMMVNNETGAVYNIPAIARAMKAKCPEAILHVDATQGYMKIPFTKAGIGADLITISSHKIEGPKGVGALIVGKDVMKNRGIAPIVHGGGQEMGLRSGTENVPGIAAFAEAAKLAHSELSARIGKMNNLRNRLVEKIASDERLSEISLTLPENHAPHILNLTLPAIKSETMLHYLSSEGIFVSSGSACSSNGGHLSSALTAYGRSSEDADSSVRVSFAPSNTEEDVDALCEALAQGLERLARIKR